MSGHGDGGAEDDQPLVTVRTVDLGVAFLFLVASAIVIYDSGRIGYGWLEGQGPAPGYFPFYIAVIMAIASSVNFLRAALGIDRSAAETFVGKTGFGRVLAVLVPTIGYVAMIQFLGIYVASAIFIAGFMVLLGKEPIWKAVVIGIGVPIALFFMFEKWFLVPLPKGPLEAMLGLG